MKLLLALLLISMSAKELTGMADKVIKRDGMTIRHNFSVVFEGEPGRMPGTPMSKDDLRRAAELIKADPAKYGITNEGELQAFLEEMKKQMED
jgi:hypothetical protein